MTAPSTFERVYASIKERLVSGDFRPGERLEPVHLSEELNSSVTPVRDALHRLTGERLVDAPKQEGFRVPVVSEVMLRWLYQWHRDLLLLALASRVLRTASPSEPASDFGSGRSSLLQLAETSGNPELVHALQSLRDRLGPFERVEAQLLDGFEDEAAAIAKAVTDRNLRDLRRLLLAYHRRRARIVPDLIAIAAQR
ncbi:GntR family transcriptional regulator [Sphingomonas sabuli]|uniref:GntR family transcriptional regulator n=1 Tax=Sphingomonas sabuli TaxID=2764186 RepID=A0A7G9L3Z5_9SPHN|nr:GntR family transcriptional regulator [Sphingomonas sabuli]QNM83344.1 GntR family transcriptional regulator [Sphingomonas sabuli]